MKLKNALQVLALTAVLTCCGCVVGTRSGYVAVGPGPVYYAPPPPVYYAPPPVYYGPPPVVYYYEPGRSRHYR